MLTSEILGFATVLTIILIKTTTPAPDLDLGISVAFPGCLAPAAMILQGEQSTHGSVPSVGTAGEQGCYASAGSWGRHSGLGFIAPGMLVEPWQHSFDHNGKHIQRMTKIWRFTPTLLPVTAQIRERPSELTLFYTSCS